MRHAAHGIDPRLVRHGDVGAARVGHDQRTARLPEVAFGIEMQHLWAHASIAGALQDAAAAAADRIARGRIAERELVIAVRVILVLARVAPYLRKLPVDAGAARSRHDGKDAVEHLASRKILIEAEMHQIAKHAAALRNAETQRMADARPLLRRQRIVLRRVPQERDDVADRGETDAHHDWTARTVDELKDRAVVEARRGRPRDLDMAVVDQTPREAGRREARIGLALPYRQRRTGRVGNRI